MELATKDNMSFELVFLVSLKEGGCKMYLRNCQCKTALSNHLPRSSDHFYPKLSDQPGKYAGWCRVSIKTYTFLLEKRSTFNS